MAPQEITIREIIKNAQGILDTETGIPPAFRSMIKLLLVLAQLLADKHGLTSREKTLVSKNSKKDKPIAENASFLETYSSLDEDSTTRYTACIHWNRGCVLLNNPDSIEE